MTSYWSLADAARDRLREQASDWLARRDGGFAPEERAQFEAWLAEAPENRAAFTEVSAAWQVINRPRDAGQAERVLRELAARKHQRVRRRVARTLSVGALAAAAVWAFTLLPFAARTFVTLPETVTLRPMQQALPDGSVVELNAGAELSVEFSPARRGVTLLRGEAHFAVAKDPARPFIVSVGAMEVRAIGTEFLVRHAPDEIKVLVTEGRVGVARPAVTAAAPELESAASASAPPEPDFVLSAGRQAVISTAAATGATPRLQHVAQAAIDAALAWRGKHVEFSGTPLSEALALLNGQNQIQLTLGNPAHGPLRVSGRFWLDDPEGFARLLEASFNIRAQRVSASEIALQ